MSKFKKYRRLGHAEMRPYEDGEDLTGVSVNEQDTPTAGDHIAQGGMVARNPDNHADQWYVAPRYFLDNFESEPFEDCID